MRMK